MGFTKSIGELFPKIDEIPDRFLLKDPVQQRKYLINGELKEWKGEMQEVLSPVCVQTADGLKRQPIGAFPLMTSREAIDALSAAIEAYDYGRGEWPGMSVAGRIESVRQFAGKMQEKRDEVVRLLMWEIGKSHSDAEKEFDRTVVYITDTIDALKELDRASSRFTIAEGIIGQIRRAPLGVALCMGPFNYPLNETFATLIPALIMGNTVILKPPRHGILLFNPLLEALRDCFPPGVVNTLYGAGRTVIPPLMETGKLDVFAFIGTSKAANQLQKAHPHPNKLRLILGLEAKNPAIVLPDADVDNAVQECIAGSLSFNGQRCTALKIIFVHEEIADVFLDKFSAGIDRLSLGMPWESGVSITPLPEEGKPEYLAGLVEDAVGLGARVINRGGGEILATFYKPAVVYPVDDRMRLYREEQFGPVIPVVRFTSLEEPINYITEADYGQQVSIFGRDTRRLSIMIDHLVNQVCRVNINSQCRRGPDIFPLTGRKNSAVGTLSVSDALRSFSIRTLVAANDTEPNKEIIREIVRERSSTFLSTDFIL